VTIHYAIEVRDRYLYLAGEGTEDGLEENIEIHKMIVNTCKEHNCPRVLIDDRNVVYTASLLSLYQLAKHYSQVDIPRFIQRAAVVTNSSYKANNQFFENTVRNRNINLRVFYDLEEAEQWLTT
jgi:hypothetical protein